MKNGLKILTVAALLATLTGCTNSDAKISPINFNLDRLATTINSSLISNTNDFFINEFHEGVGTNAINNVLPNATNTNMTSPYRGISTYNGNTRPLVNNNVNTYRNNRANNQYSMTMNDFDTGYNTIANGAYVSRYESQRDKSLISKKVAQIENLYNIAYDVSLAKGKFATIRNQVMSLIETTKTNLISNNAITANQNAALNEYAVTIKNITNTINNANSLYNANVTVGNETLGSLDNQAYRSAKYINMLNCIDTQIAALENAVSTLNMINSSILNNEYSPNINGTNNTNNTTTMNNDQHIARPNSGINGNMNNTNINNPINSMNNGLNGNMNNNMNSGLNGNMNNNMNSGLNGMNNNLNNTIKSDIIGNNNGMQNNNLNGSYVPAINNNNNNNMSHKLPNNTNTTLIDKTSPINSGVGGITNPTLIKNVDNYTQPSITNNINTFRRPSSNLANNVNPANMPNIIANTKDTEIMTTQEIPKDTLGSRASYHNGVNSNKNITPSPKSIQTIENNAKNIDPKVCNDNCPIM